MYIPEKKFSSGLMFFFFIIIVIGVFIWGSCRDDDDDNSGPPPDNVILVDCEATGANNGESWSDAFTKLESAFELFEPGKEIWVAEGTYHPAITTTSYLATFNLPENCMIYGGFQGHESSLSQRNWESHRTILSGDLNDDDDATGNTDDNAYYCVTGAMNATLDGFVITGGWGDGEAYPPACRAALEMDETDMSLSNCTFERTYSLQGCILLDRAVLTLENCTFLENKAGSGTCVNMNGGTIHVDGCLFQNNIATTSHSSSGGAAIKLSWIGPHVISHSVFINNQTNGRGGALNAVNLVGNDDVTLTISHCFFYQNSARLGGAVGIEDLPSTITNCVFSENQGYVGGAIHFWLGHTSVITNCTFSRNSAIAKGGALYFTPGTIQNCILWGNTAQENPQIYTSGGFPIHHSLIQDSFPGGEWDSNLGTNLGGNIDRDPLFVNANVALGSDAVASTSDDGLYLSAGSPAIDSGTTDNAPTDDICGSSRPQGNGPDMGAYESF